MPERLKFLTVIAVVVGSVACLQLAPAQSRQSSIPLETDSRLSARQCLTLAKDWLEQEKFEKARVWYKAARDRADDPELRKLARRQLVKLRLLGKPAPKLSLDKWIHGRDRRSLAEKVRGKVVLLNFFQLACQESNHAIHHVMDLAERHRGRGLTVVSIAVVLGQEAFQQSDMIKQFVTMQNFNHRVGLDTKEAKTFQVYRGIDTPYAALLDRDGRVRWLGRFDREAVERKLIKLLAEEVGQKLPGRSIIMPMSRGGRDRIDKRAPRLNSKIWLNTPGGQPPQLLGRPRLIRFFTDGCTYCRASAPALNRIHRDYAKKGLVVVGIYHPKPQPRDVSFEDFHSAVRQLELQFPTTVDADWEYLEKIWLGARDRNYTSVSFLIDRKGVIRYVHPGPDFFPSDDPAKVRQNEDYQAIRRAVEKVLAE